MQNNKLTIDAVRFESGTRLPDEIVKAAAESTGNNVQAKKTSEELSKKYASFSGADVRLLADGKILGTVQSFNTTLALGGQAKLVLDLLILDEIPSALRLDSSLHNFELKAYNEYGMGSVLLILDSATVEQFQFGGSVDDILLLAQAIITGTFEPENVCKRIATCPVCMGDCGCGNAKD